MSTSDETPPPSNEMQALSLARTSEFPSSTMSGEERLRIVRSVREDRIQEDELLRLLSKKPHPICYDGFEPSGRMHIAQGILKTTSVNKLTSAGCKVKIGLRIYWFAQLNNKMGGDLAKIRTVGLYMVEIWKPLFVWANSFQFQKYIIFW